MVLGSGGIDHPESLCFLRKNQFNFTINMFIELSKSEANWDIAVFVKQKVITVDELDGFREDLIDAVKLICKRQIPRELYISEGKPTLHGKTAHLSRHTAHSFRFSLIMRLARKRQIPRLG